MLYTGWLSLIYRTKEVLYVNKYHNRLDPVWLEFDFRAGYDNEVLGLVFTEPTQHSASPVQWVGSYFKLFKVGRLVAVLIE